MPYKVAVIVSPGSPDPSPLPKGLPFTYDVIAHTFATDKRYFGSELSRVPWDSDADWESFSHILITDELVYTDCVDEFLQWLDRLPLRAKERLINPPGVIKWNVNKSYLLDFKAKGIRIPATVIVHPGTNPDVSHVIQELGNISKLVIKNLIDADGTSTKLVTLNDLETAYTKAILESKHGLVIQEYLPGIQEEGEWSVVLINKEITHGARKTPTSGEFRIQTRYGGKEEPLEKHFLPQDVLDFALDVVAATDDIIAERLCYARVDIVRNPEGLPCLMEFEAFEPTLYLFDEKIRKKLVDAIFLSDK